MCTWFEFNCLQWCDRLACRHWRVARAVSPLAACRFTNFRHFETHDLLPVHGPDEKKRQPRWQAQLKPAGLAKVVAIKGKAIAKSSGPTLLAQLKAVLLL